MTVEVTYDGISFEVSGAWQDGHAGGLYEPPEASGFEAESILHDGEDLYDMLSEQVLTSIISSAKKLAQEAEREAV